MLPKSLIQQSKDKPASFWEDSMKNSGKNVVIYFHGNTGSRAVHHRMELYLILQQLDYHVISFDYRGYADSTQEPPNETSVVTDGLAVYKYVQSVLAEESKDVNVFIWGHSLGTGKSLQTKIEVGSMRHDFNECCLLVQECLVMLFRNCAMKEIHQPLCF